MPVGGHYRLEDLPSVSFSFIRREIMPGIFQKVLREAVRIAPASPKKLQASLVRAPVATF